MKTLLYAGHAFTTTDEVARALLDYVVTIPHNQAPEVVMIPAMRDGERVVAHLVLTASTPLALHTVEGREVALDGEDYAVEVLRRKASRLAAVGFDTP